MSRDYACLCRAGASNVKKIKYQLNYEEGAKQRILLFTVNYEYFDAL